MRARPQASFLTSLLTLLLGLSVTAPSRAAATPPAVTRASVDAGYGRQPLAFVENRGQVDRRIRYYERGAGHATAFTSEGVTMSLTRRPPRDRMDGQEPGARRPDKGPAPTDVVELRLSGAAPSTAVIAEARLPGVVNHLVGDRSRWRTGVPTFGALRYRDVRPGVDVRFYGTASQLEYDVIVRPGADPAAVAFEYRGARGLSVGPDGALDVALAGGHLLQRRPFAFQVVAGRRVEVAAAFELRGGKEGRHAYGFRVGPHDPSRELVIDPIMAYATYLGGSGYDYAAAIAADASGNAYVTGSTSSADFPIQAPAGDLAPGLAGGGDAFVTKLDPGGRVVYSTFLGGSGSEDGSGIAVDPGGRVYVTGATDSTDFSGATPALRGATDAFVSKLGASGLLEWTTLVGGGSLEYPHGIALDPAGSAYLTGETRSHDFPATPGALQTTYEPSGIGNFGLYETAFVAKLGADGQVAWATYLAGARFGNGMGFTGSGIAVDAAGSPYVTGFALVIPDVFGINLFGGVAPTRPGSYVIKLDPSGASIDLESYFGGTGHLVNGLPVDNLGNPFRDRASAIALNSWGDAYVTGTASSPDFPIVRCSQQCVSGGGVDAFVMVIIWDGTASGTYVDWSQFIGGAGYDGGLGIAVDDLGTPDVAGGLYVTGETGSPDFPTSADAFQASLGGREDAFLYYIDQFGEFPPRYSSYLGGSDWDLGMAIALDPAGNVYLAGEADSTDLPTTANAGQRSAGGGGGDAFVARVGFNLAPLSLGQAGLPGGTVGAPYFASLVAVGGVPGYHFAVSGLPAGLAFESTTGAITGTPTAGGRYDLHVSLSDSGTPASQASGVVTITVLVPLELGTTALPPGRLDVAYVASLAGAGGVLPYAFAAAGLPEGLVLDPSTGVISGKPTKAGTFPVDVSVTDATSTTASAVLSLVVTSPLQLDTTALPAGQVAIAYGTALAASGGTAPYSFSAAGLPPGLTLQPSTGAISGTPTTAETFPVAASVSDSAGAVASTVLSLFVAPSPLLLSTTSLPAGTVGIAYAAALGGSGGVPPYTFSAVGLPPGLALDPSTGAISGTPASAATYPVNASIVDSAGTVTSATLSLVVNPSPLLLVAPALQTCASGSPCSIVLTASGGTPPYGFAAAGLPFGLALDPLGGVISGAPAIPGTFPVAVSVTDSAGSVAGGSLSLIVTAIPAADLSVAASADKASVLVGEQVTLSVQVRNAGPATSHGATFDLVTNELFNPAFFTQVSSSLPVASCATSSTGTLRGCPVGDLGPGASITFTAVIAPGQVIVDGMSPGVPSQDQPFVATVVPGPAELDTPGNERSAAAFAVRRFQADLGVVLQVSPASILVGEQVTLRAVVTNGGPDTAHGATLSILNAEGVLFDPASFALVSAPPALASCTATLAAGLRDCPLGDLAPNGTATWTMVFAPTQALIDALPPALQAQGMGITADVHPNPAEVELAAANDRSEVGFGVRRPGTSSGVFPLTLPNGTAPVAEISAPGGETLLDLSISPSLPTAPGVTFVVGTISYTAWVTPGGSAAVAITLPGSLAPALDLFKVDVAGQPTLLPRSLWTRLDTGASTVITLTLTDGGPFDLDGQVNGVIVDPVAIGEVAAPPAAAIDLVPTALTTSSSRVQRGGDLKLVATVANRGTKPAANVRVKFYLSPDASVTVTDTAIASGTLKSVPAGKSAKLSVTGRVPKALAPGTYRVGVIVDPDDSQAELSESNNTLVATGILTVRK